MARGKKKESALTPEEKVAQALVPVEEQPYKVPENWCWTRGTAIFREMETRKPIGEFFDYIDIDAIDNSLQVVTEPKHMAVKDAPSRASRAVHYGDTVFSLVRPYLKNIAFIDESLKDCIASTGFYVCSPSPVVDPRYLYLLMTSSYVVDGLNEYMKGDNSPSIRKDDIELFAYPVPPLAEQQRIVNRIEYLFAKLDEAKEKAQSVLDSFETRKAAILHKAFTGELSAKWRAEHGGQGWSIVTLGDVCRFENGYAFKSDKFSDVEGTPVVRISNISEMGVDVDGCILTTEVNIDKRFQVQYGDLLIAMSGATTGKNGVYLSDKIAFLNQRVGNIKIKDPSQLVPGYRNYYILHMRETILQNAYGGAQPNISSGKICSMEFPLSLFEEQQEIVRILDSLFAKEQQAKEAAEAVLEKIDLLKKSILARAFRGELGTNDPSEESALEQLKAVLN